MHCFLKVLTTFYKVISKIISTIVIKNVTIMKIRKILRIYSKTLNLLMQHDNCGALRDLVAFAQFKKREKHP